MTRQAVFNIYHQRPLQARSLEAQAIELGLDPLHCSPVEAKLGEALLALLLDPNEFGPPGFINLFLPVGSVRGLNDLPPISLRKPGVINVVPGCWVDKYQADYLLDVKAPGSRHVARGILECDGAAFHDNTQEQRSHDRERDRDFQNLGIWVLRYTAIDIHDRPEHCAKDAISVLLRRSAAKGWAA